MRGESSRKLTGEQIDEVVRRYDNGKGETVQQLAKAFGVSESPIRNALKMRNVRVRVGGNRRGHSGGWNIS